MLVRENLRRIGMLVIFLVSMALAIPPCLNAIENKKPMHGMDGWKVSLPAAQGMQTGMLNDAVRYLNGTDATSLIVIRHGCIVLEKYYRGQCPGDYCFAGSMANLLLSALVGKEIQIGNITSVDQKLMAFFPDYQSRVKDPKAMEVTIAHLLTMTSGYGPIPQETFYRLDWIGSQLTRPLLHKPGEFFSYSAKTPYLLSGILTKAAGVSALDLARKYIFNPLSIQNAVWHTGPEKYNIGGDFLYMKPLDMAKIGCLYLNGGTFAGKQVLSEEWIRKSFQLQTAVAKKSGLQDDCTGYGYQLAIRSVGGVDVYMAEGDDTTPNLCIIPELDMILVITSYPSFFKTNYSYENLKHVLLHNVIPSVLQAS